MLSRLTANTGSQTAGAFDGFAVSAPRTACTRWEALNSAKRNIPVVGIDEVQWWP